MQEASSAERVYPPDPAFAEKARVPSKAAYDEMYRASVADGERFWLGQAKELLDWIREPTVALSGGFSDLDYRWFEDGVLNVAANCLDRHLDAGRGNKAALIWEGDDGSSRTFTYQELHNEVCRFAWVLRDKGIGRGDRVAIYLPMVPELPIAMLACARIGAIHSVVFGGFSSSALTGRFQDSGARLLITADAGMRGGRHVPLKASADEALRECPTVESCIVVKRGSGAADMEPGRDTWWHDEMSAPEVRRCEYEPMNAEDPLFILYTSGSTGKPKGVVHTSAGYLLWSQMTFETVFDVRDDDVFWCTADIGWVTGHSYIVYGPLSSGATAVMFEGVPTYPDPARFWQVIEKYKVTSFYTAPTALRALMRHGDEWTQKHDLSTLRVLGSVGEPINPEVWEWYRRNIGGGRCPIVDTYWQTETGGFVITPLPGAIALKPGSATLPFPGVVAHVLNDRGKDAEAGESGYLTISAPWPGMLRGTWGDTETKTRLRETYFERFPGHYFTGDGARRDEDGYFWLEGRIDDVINVSGHRLGTAEIESALVSHDAVSEAAVVGMPHPVKGEGIYAYVVLRHGVVPDENLAKVLIGHVRTVIGPIATPDSIQFAPDLPKTRSGKIMRRILRKIAAGETSEDAFGDTSTLTDPRVVQELVSGAERY